MKFAYVLNVCLLAVSVTACRSGDSTSAPQSNASQQKLSMSWADAYPTIAEMVGKADAVIVGRTGNVAGASVVDGIPYTDFTYTVINWIVGRPSGQQITIHQTGGREKGSVVEAEDDPLLVPGEQSVLFVREYARGKFRIMGGPTGRLLRKNDKVQALPGGRAHDGLPTSLNAFRQRLRQLAIVAGKQTQ